MVWAPEPPLKRDERSQRKTKKEKVPSVVFVENSYEGGGRRENRVVGEAGWGFGLKSQWVVKTDKNNNNGVSEKKND